MADNTALATITGAPIEWTDKQKELAIRTVCRGASPDEFDLFMAVCQRTQLDPFARQIYSIRRKQWNSQSRSYEEAQVIQVSIDGFRLIADRTAKYAGQVGPWWCGKDGEWKEVWLVDEPPAAAKVGVLRHDFQQPLYAIALYKSYVQTNNSGDPISRWKTDPAGMLAKCAESLALRRAFPAELYGLYTTEEMGQVSGPNQSDDVFDGATGQPVTTTPPVNGAAKQQTPAPVADAPEEPPFDADPPAQPPAPVAPTNGKANGNGKLTMPMVVDHLVMMSGLIANRVRGTLAYCDLKPETATLKQYECWWSEYKAARNENFTPQDAGTFANLMNGANPDPAKAAEFMASIKALTEQPAK